MPTKTEVFFDTNILVYAIDSSDRRHSVARRLLLEGGQLGVQVLNEFASVASRKFDWTWPQITAALSAFRKLCQDAVPVTAEIHEHALRLAARDGLNIYDGLIAAAAIKAGCRTLLTEDMQHGRVIEDRLTIRNPFLD